MAIGLIMSYRENKQTTHRANGGGAIMTVAEEGTRNEQLARRFIEEVGNNRNSAALEELMAPDYVSHPMWYEPFTPPSMQGKSELEMMKEYCRTGDPNYTEMHVSVDQMFSAADRVVSLTTTTATRDGKSVSWASMFIDRFRDGKLVESWYSYDRLGIYQQLGTVPATGKLRETAALI
jgi:ketosteroid isomerase-like protein